MIRKFLPITKNATFSILLPDPSKQDMPIPRGTGFFISTDGWFVTALHVISENNAVRKDIEQAVLMKEQEAGKAIRMCQAVKVVEVIPKFDFALLKVDFELNKNKEWLKTSQGFPFLQISSMELSDGEPVYAFGYPLPDNYYQNNGNFSIGHNSLCPRVTSAIVSSRVEKTQMITTDGAPQVYVLDKALNYGNSGGPILSVETGHVHAFCSRFQPVYIPQHHLSKNNPNISIVIPSLYGIVINLGHPAIIKILQKNGITILK